MKFGIAKLNAEGTSVAVIASGKRIAEAPSWNEAVAQLVKAFAEFAPEDVEEAGTGAAFHAQYDEKDEARDSGGMTRVCDDGAVRLDRDPIPVMILTETPEMGGHGGAELCAMGSPSRAGSIISIDGNFHTTEPGAKAEDLVGNQGLNTHSPDYIDVTYEQEVTAVDDDGFPTEFLIRFTDCMLGGITIAPIQALDSAFIKLADAAGEAPPAASDTERDPVETDDADTEETAVAAAGGPQAPPAEWFEEPEFTEATPFTIEDSGYLYGYLALKGECHIGFQDRCVMAPSSASDYAYFTTGAIKPGGCDCDVPVGVITMSTGHAGLQLSHRAAAEHYDNTGTQVADVVVGEDDRGIWVAGALRSGLTDEQVRSLKASSLSGDWRPIRGGLELVGVLAVNVPGFPVPRARVASGELEALVAAGGGPLAKLKEQANDPVMSRLTALEGEVAELRRTARNLQPVEVEQIRKRVAS